MSCKSDELCSVPETHVVPLYPYVCCVIYTCTWVTHTHTHIKPKRKLLSQYLYLEDTVRSLTFHQLDCLVWVQSGLKDRVYRMGAMLRKGCNTQRYLFVDVLVFILLLG